MKKINIEKLLKKAKIVSFDMFDTLVFRPYLQPEDVFLHMAKAYNKHDFYTARIDAEQKARELSNRQDITFDEIYALLDKRFQDMKQKELDWEMMILRPNPEMKKIWNLAKSLDKKIIIVSDVYLSPAFIKKILNKNGFDGYDKLYISSSFGKTKHTGDLFDLVIKDIAIEPKYILHIGDSKNSDYEMPKKKGIKSFLYPKIAKKFVKLNPKIQNFYNMIGDDLCRSISQSLAAFLWQQHRLSGYECSKCRKKYPGWAKNFKTKTCGFFNQ